MEKQIMFLIRLLLIGSLSTADGFRYLRCTDVFETLGNTTWCNDLYVNSYEIFIFRLPDHHNSIIESMMIQVHPRNSLEIDGPDTFQNYSRLKSLSITGRVIFSPRAARSWNTLRSELFASLWRLEGLSIRVAGFNSHHHSWKLPSGLKRLGIASTDYTEFDLSGCPNLEFVNFRNNPLIKIPTFSDRLPTVLNLKNNPLLEFSVNDIAKFCRTQIELQYNSMGSHHRRCECQRLLNWSKIIMNPDHASIYFELKCNLNATSLEDCKEYTLDEALKIRNVCLYGPEVLACDCARDCPTSTPTPVTCPSPTLKPLNHAISAVEPQSETICIVISVAILLLTFIEKKKL